MRLSQILESREQVMPEYLYYGPRERMIAEIGSGDYYEGKYLVQPVGEESWDAEGANSIPALKALIKEYQWNYPGIKLVSL